MTVTKGRIPKSRDGGRHGECDSRRVRILRVLPAMVIGLALCAQAPPQPGQPQAASGTITVLVNGKPIATGGTLNIKSGQGVIASASPDTALNGTDITFDADSAVMLARDFDQRGADHVIVATSPVFPGAQYSGAPSPPLTSPTFARGSWFILFPDVPNIAGAKLDAGLGPVAMKTVKNGSVVAVTGGECTAECFVIAYGSPPTAWLVK